MGIVILQGRLVAVKESKKGMQLKFLAPEYENWSSPDKCKVHVDFKTAPTKMKLTSIQMMWGESGQYSGCPWRRRKDGFYFWVDDAEDSEILKGVKKNLSIPSDLLNYDCIITARAERYHWFDKDVKLMKMGWRLILRKLET